MEKLHPLATVISDLLYLSVVLLSVFKLELFAEVTFWIRPGVSNLALGVLPSSRVQTQPQSNTPETSNQGLEGYLKITDRCVESELKFTALQEQD